MALHGDMEQSARTAALDKFRKGEADLLVASDVAARGLDIPEVSHVFNFDVPHHADDYVHRIGRTGRAGKSGIAITIVAPGRPEIGRRDREADGQTDRSSNDAEFEARERRNRKRAATKSASPASPAAGGPAKVGDHGKGSEARHSRAIRSRPGQ